MERCAIGGRKHSGGRHATAVDPGTLTCLALTVALRDAQRNVCSSTSVEDGAARAAGQVDTASEAMVHG